MKDRESMIDEMRSLELIEGVDYYKALYDLIESNLKPLHAIEVIDRAVEVVKAEPEIINSSSSYRHGYARCSRDNEQALEQLKQEYSDGN